MTVQVTVTFRVAAVSVDAVAFLHVSPAFEAIFVSLKMRIFTINMISPFSLYPQIHDPQIFRFPQFSAIFTMIHTPAHQQTLDFDQVETPMVIYL